MRVLAYVRVSTDEQATNGAGLDAQRSAIERECVHRGDELVEIVTDGGFSAKDLRRPGITSVLERLSDGEADVLMVAKLDRLSRSIHDFIGILALAKKQRWAVVALDCAVDTTTPQGKLLTGMLAMFAEFERDIISERIRDALAVRKAQGVRLGRPTSIPDYVRDRIVLERSEGVSLAQIAARLNEDGIATGQGGRQWWPSTVRAALQAA